VTGDALQLQIEANLSGSVALGLGHCRAASPVHRIASTRRTARPALAACTGRNRLLAKSCASAETMASCVENRAGPVDVRAVAAQLFPRQGGTKAEKPIGRGAPAAGDSAAHSRPGHGSRPAHPRGSDETSVSMDVTPRSRATSRTAGVFRFQPRAPRWPCRSNV